MMRAAFLKSLLPAATLALAIIATPASAWIACSQSNDCWYTDTNTVQIPNVKLSFFPDSDLERIKADKRYVWHPKDNLHNWLHGYWLFGNWYTR
jgi:hypothetical protein